MNTSLICFLLIAAALPGLGCIAEGEVYQGSIVVEGNEPFSRLVLITDEQTRYLLQVDPFTRDSIQNSIPGRIRVVGTAVEGEWEGQPHEIIRVSSWKWIDTSHSE